MEILFERQHPEGANSHSCSQACLDGQLTATYYVEHLVKETILLGIIRNSWCVVTLSLGDKDRTESHIYRG